MCINIQINQTCYLVGVDWGDRLGAPAVQVAFQVRGCWLCSEWALEPPCLSNLSSSSFSAIWCIKINPTPGMGVQLLTQTSQCGSRSFWNENSVSRMGKYDGKLLWKGCSQLLCSFWFTCFKKRETLQNPAETWCQILLFIVGLCWLSFKAKVSVDCVCEDHPSLLWAARQQSWVQIHP